MPQMKLGEFRRQTAGVADEADLLIQWEGDEEFAGVDRVEEATAGHAVIVHVSK